MISAEGIRFRLEPWHCPVCQGSQEKTVGYRGGAHQREGKGIVTKVVRCKSCTLLYANPFPVAENLGEVYGDPVSYFASHDCTAKISANQVMLSRLLEFSPRPHPVLDVGAGLGELLVAARNLGIKAEGLEISEAMAAEARRRHNVEVNVFSIERAAELWPGRFGAVILNAVLEHVYDPAAMIAAANTLLREGGVLYLDVPNEPSLPTMLGNLARRLYGSRTVYNLSPTWEPFHVYGFNSRALRILLGKNGFAVREVKVYADSHYHSTGGFADRAACIAASAAARLANLTGTASNLSLWAVKSS